MEIEALDEWQDKTLRDLKLRSKYGINVMAIKKGDEINLTPSADDTVESKDIIVAIGSAQDLANLEGVIVKFK